MKPVTRLLFKRMISAYSNGFNAVTIPLPAEEMSVKEFVELARAEGFELTCSLHIEFREKGREG